MISIFYGLAKFGYILSNILWFTIHNNKLKRFSVAVLENPYGGGASIIWGVRRSSVVRAFTHGAMGCRIDHSWWTHWAISHSSQCSMTGVTKVMVCVTLSEVLSLLFITNYISVTEILWQKSPMTHWPESISDHHWATMLWITTWCQSITNMFVFN